MVILVTGRSQSLSDGSLWASLQEHVIEGVRTPSERCLAKAALRRLHMSQKHREYREELATEKLEEVQAEGMAVSKTLWLIHSKNHE